MGGIQSQVFLYQIGSNVEITYRFNYYIQWQIHELPVDFTVNPKLRCRQEYVGRSLPYSSRGGRIIPNVTTASLIMNSIVLGVNGEPVACGTIIPLAVSYSLAKIDFTMGLIGKIYITQWPCKYMNGSKTVAQLSPLCPIQYCL